MPVVRRDQANVWRQVRRGDRASLAVLDFFLEFFFESLFERWGEPRPRVIHPVAVGR